MAAESHTCFQQTLQLLAAYTHVATLAKGLHSRLPLIASRLGRDAIANVDKSVV